MNYLELINRFWTKSIEYRFTDREIALYFYILNICYSGRWNNSCGLANSTVMSIFGWGKTSFERTRNRLRDTYLIDFRQGLGRGNISQYFIRDMDDGNHSSSAVSVQASLFDAIGKYGKGRQTDSFPESKGIRENIFSGRIPERSIEKDIPNDAFPDRFSGSAFEKSTQKDTFQGDISDRDAPEDTFSMQKEDSKDAFPDGFLEKYPEKDTLLAPKPLKTPGSPSPDSLNDNTIITTNHSNISISDHQENIENRKLDDAELEFSGEKKEGNPDSASSENEKKEKGSGQKEKEVVALYRSVCGSFPAIIRLTCNRKGKILQRLREMGSTNILEQVFRKMEASDFLKGNNRYGWKATFDWVFKNQENWMKILEGNYDNRTPQPQFVQPANDPRFMGMLQTDLSKF